MSKLTDEKLAEIEEKVMRVQEAMDSWRQTGLPERTLVILLQHYTKLSQKDIRLMMEGMDALYDEYFKENQLTEGK